MRNKFIFSITQKIKEVERDIIERWRKGLISEEEDISSQLAVEIDKALSSLNVYGIKVETKVFTRKSSKSEESIIGADLGIILEVRNNNPVSKCILVQSKKEVNYSLNIDSRLKNQCSKMLNITSDSFVFIYSKYPYWGKNYIRVIPAFRIFNLTLSKISGYALSLSTFFKYFLSCYIGDHKIMQVVKYPENLLEHAKNVLVMKITPTEERWLT